jgi:hypothetical protein
MPRQWHVDGSELNYELDGIFASGSATEPSQYWEVSKLEVVESHLAVPFVDILSFAPCEFIASIRSVPTTSGCQNS